MSVDSEPNDGRPDDKEWGPYEGRQKQFPFTIISKYNIIANNDAKPKDFYEQYITDDIIHLMVNETNSNADSVISKLRLSRRSRLKNWKPTNPDEMKKFLGLLMWMGLVPLPKITDYWSNNTLYKNEVARNVMSRNRFQLILRFWHFNSNENLQRDGRLGKILPLITKLNDLFSSNKDAEQVLAVDESMVPFRGRLAFRQYIPSKTHKYGVKIFKLCDKTRVYLWRQDIYGKGDQHK